MREQLAQRLAQGIQLLQSEGHYYYTNAELARLTGVSPSTLKRNKEFIHIMDTAIHINGGTL